MVVTTSIYFCAESNHSACRHGKMRYLTPHMIITRESAESLKTFSLEKKILAEVLQNKEKFYQIALQHRLGFGHERLNSQNITDLSDEYNILEIKKWNQFRQAMGQIQEYSHIKSKKQGHARFNKYILLFGNTEIPPDIWDRWIFLSNMSRIELLNCGSAIHFVNDYIEGIKDTSVR